MVTKEQLDNFHSFATRQLEAGRTDLSMDDLYDLWCADNLSAAELSESITSVRAALAEMDAGDLGIPADEHLARLRAKYQLPDEA